MKRLLSYLGEASLEGRADDLKEYTVGVDAFGKPDHYDPQADPTVRVQAGKLRQKIEEYYRAEGAGDPVRISFPKGHFRIFFETAVPPGAEPARSGGEPRAWRSAAVVLAAVAIAAVAAAVFYARKANLPTASAARWTPELETLWRPLLAGDAPIQIAYESMLFLVIPEWTFRHGGLDDPPDIRTSPLLKELMSKLGNPPLRWEYNYAGFGAVQGVFLLSRLLDGRKPPLLVKRGSVLTWEEIQANQLVFLGVGKSKTRIRELLAKGEFQWEYHRIKNLKPLRGEASEYLSVWDPETSTWTEQYGLISMLPGFHEGRYVFVIGGGSSEGDWAAAEYVTTPRYAKELVTHLRGASGQMPEAYQAVIRIRYSAQVPVEMSYVTHHVLGAK